jgi:hypothetical protein
MNVRLSTLTDDELADASDKLSSSAVFLRSLGRYQAAAQCLSVSRECCQILIRRGDDHRDSLARQLSLIPPGAYDEPLGA